jgi:archaeosine synthase
MEFRITTRDGPARIGTLSSKNNNVVTPAIFFIHTSRYKSPNFAECVITAETFQTDAIKLHIGDSAFSFTGKKIFGDVVITDYLQYPKDVSKELHDFSLTYNKKTLEKCMIIPASEDIFDEFHPEKTSNFFVISCAKQFFHQPLKFIRFVTSLRKKIGYQKVIYLPCVGDPLSFSLLAYMSVDCFDSSSAVIAARNGKLLFSTGSFHIDEIKELPCACPVCTKFQHTVSDMKFADILQHNYYILINEIKQVKNAIFTGKLRELVEQRVRGHPLLASMLKNLDYSQYEFLEERVPMTRDSQLLATSRDSLFRPEVRRFQDRVIDRYEKPADAHVLLLLPCSAKKPYSFSKTHKLIQERLHQVPNTHGIHQVVITSPLGIVPKELELVYPASSYDIAVTGRWDEDEKKIIRTLLAQFLAKNSYEHVILHVPPPLQNVIHGLFDDPLITCKKSPISMESLDYLEETLKKIVPQKENVNYEMRTFETMKAVATYQFGKKAAEIHLDGCTIKGRYPQLKIKHHQKQRGMVTLKRGLISLTFEGAKQLAKTQQYWVDVSDDFVVKGSIFAPGVANADKQIRIGDEVIIRQNNDLCGVGVACMNGEEMIEVNHGEAVKTRHTH